METLTISEVAQQVGIRPSAIRYYESVNLLPTPRRVSGQRRYDRSILERLSFIQVAQKLGFTLTEMQVLLQEQDTQAPMSERWRILARSKLSEVDALIARAQIMKRLLEQGLDCGCADLQECMQCVVENYQHYDPFTIFSS